MSSQIISTHKTLIIIWLLLFVYMGPFITAVEYSEYVCSHLPCETGRWNESGLANFLWTLREIYEMRSECGSYVVQ